MHNLKFWFELDLDLVQISFDSLLQLNSNLTELTFIVVDWESASLSLGLKGRGEKGDEGYIDEFWVLIQGGKV